jgi:uncharacterized membrane protein
MHRRPIGRGRLVAVLGALVLLAACFLPWYRIGGDAGNLTEVTYSGFNRFGILAFIAALATLALVALPYAAGDRPVSGDRALVYGLLLLLALIGVAAWPIEFLGDLLVGLLPDRAPGWWLAVVGVVILARAVFEIAQEPARR